jgi:hypothetical protein
MNEESIIVGKLEPGTEFKLPDKETIYRVLTRRKWNASPAHGVIDCLNLDTNKSEQVKCKTVVVVSRGTELSE